MPAMSPTMRAGNIPKWSIAEGAKINPGTVIAEIETDKATIDWESTDEGFLAKILVPSPAHGIVVGAPVAVMCDAEEDIAAFKDFKVSAPEAKAATEPEAKKTHGSDSPTTQQESHSQLLPNAPLMPSAAALIRQHPTVDFSKLQATGPHGHITKGDVLRVIKGGPQGGAPKQSETQAPATPQAAPQPTPQPFASTSASGGLSSKSAVPHFYLSIDVSVKSAQKLVSSLEGTTLQDFFIAAASRALALVPEANATFHDDFSRQYKSPDIAVFTPASDGSLTTISFENPAGQKLAEIANQREGLQAQAKAQPAPFPQGNLGVVVVAVDSSLPSAPVFTIPTGRTLTLGISGVRQSVRGVVQGDKVILHTEPTVSVSLGCDHRIVDGVLGSRYLQMFQRLVEEPALVSFL